MNVPPAGVLFDFGGVIRDMRWDVALDRRAVLRGADRGDDPAAQLARAGVVVMPA